MTLPRWEIPDCWRWVDAGEVAHIVGGGTPPSKDEANFSENGIPWIGPADLTGYREVYISHGRRSLSEQGYARSGATLMPARAVLFSSRAPIGYCAIAANPISTNQGFKSWVCDAGIVPEFVRYYLLASVEYVDSLASGTTFREISGKRVEAIAFPLPPEAEQHRIVAKLDALTARLARARAELDRVPLLAARLRSQALGAIFDIQKAELAGIAVVSVGDVAEISSGYGFPKHFQGKTEGLYPFAKVSDISQAVTKQRGLLASAVNYVDRDDLKQIRAKPVSTGSTVFAKIGEALRLNRRALAQCDVILDNNCMALSPTAKLNPEYLFYFMQTVDLAPFAVATTVPSVRRGDVAGLQLPLPEPERQTELVEIIKATFARADRLEAEATRARALLDRLESALLAKAFRGELVPQDPNDEPAQTLLNRIRTQRAAAPPTKRGRRKKETA